MLKHGLIWVFLWERWEDLLEAINCFNQALEIDTENDDVGIIRELHSLIFSKYSEALECFNKALELNPEISKAWAGKGSVKRFFRRL